MLTLLFGAFGTGKTTRLFEEIAADIAEEIPSFLVVPEQNTVSVEAEAARRLPPKAPLSFEVTNFTRLADTVFRLVGGVSARYADEGTALLLARDATAAVAPLLSDRRRIDGDRVKEVMCAVRECKISAVTPEQLERAADALGGESALARKLSDLSLLLASFGGTMAAHGCHLPADGLAHLADALALYNPLAGARFRFDGFTSFTAVQRAVLGELLRSSDVTVTLPMPTGDAARRALSYAETDRTVQDLRRLASERGIPLRELALKENRRARHPVLSAIAERLFTVGAPPLPPPAEGEEEAIRILECRTPFGEAELVAADIARRVQGGARYRDFAIIARSAEAYRGVLDTALSRHGIPAYFSLPTDLSAFEAIKLIRTAYAILTGGGRREDVITYLKSGLSGIPADDCDRFELYAERWGLTGERLLGRPFRMYADGYDPPRGDSAREQAEAELRALNETRTALAAPLAILKKSCKDNITIKEHSSVLYEFLTALDVDKQLFLRAKEHEARGESERAAEYARLFREITDVLDLLTELIPDSVVSASDFSELLSLLFSSRSLRTIPVGADSVTVGSADLLRPNEPRHVYLIGVNAGVFPREGEEGGLFTSAELDSLAELGIVLDGNDLVRASREYFCFLRAFSAASESVTLSYSLTDFSFSLSGRSEALDRILALTGDRFPILREEELPLADRLFSVSSALAALGAAKDAALRDSIRRALLQIPGTAPLLERATRPLTDPQARVDTEVMDSLYRDRLSLTQSRIDRYVACPFSYFCEYVLKLSESTRIRLGSAEIGTFIHAVLEYFLGDPERASLSTLTDREIEEAVSRISDGYLASVFPEGEITPRIRHRFLRLGRRAVELLRELREEAAVSSFTPLFMEYEPSETDENAAEPPAITLEDGTRVTLYGKIDRVDVFRRDGNAYLRVIDYKTGEKKFSLDDIARGKNLQMLIYLFALWQTERRGFFETVGVAEGGHILPAGALYLNLSLKNTTVATPSAASEPLCSRSGILLNLPENLRAMDGEGEGRFIPIRLDADGNPTKGKLDSLATLEEMGALAAEVTETVRRIATRLRGGEADATPLVDKKKAPCDYCPYYPVCRNAGGASGCAEERESDPAQNN